MLKGDAHFKHEEHVKETRVKDNTAQMKPVQSRAGPVAMTVATGSSAYLGEEQLALSSWE